MINTAAIIASQTAMQVACQQMHKERKQREEEEQERKKDKDK